MANSPPKKWVDTMRKQIETGSPSHSQEQIDSIIDDIWNNEMDEDDRKYTMSRYSNKKTAMWFETERDAEIYIEDDLEENPENYEIWFEKTDDPDAPFDDGGWKIKKASKRTAQRAEPGTVSSGTLKSEELVDKFMDYLADHAPDLHQEAVEELEEGAESIQFDKGMSEEDYIDWFLNDFLFEKMESIAPEGHWFGSHPGDGADFGYWPMDVQASKKDNGMKTKKAQHGYDVEYDGENTWIEFYDDVEANDVAGYLNVLLADGGYYDDMDEFHAFDSSTISWLEQIDAKNTTYASKKRSSRKKKAKYNANEYAADPYKIYKDLKSLSTRLMYAWEEFDENREIGEDNPDIAWSNMSIDLDSLKNEFVDIVAAVEEAERMIT